MGGITRSCHVAVALGFAFAADGALAAPPGTNLIQNGGFEWVTAESVPPAWWFYTSKMGVCSIVSNVVMEGAQAVRLRAQNSPGEWSGLIQTLPVVAGQKYTMSAWVRHCDEDALIGGAYGQLVVEWQDAQGREVRRVWGKAWPKNIGEARWERVTVSGAVAPAETVKGVFGIHLYEGPRGGRGSLIFDNVSVTSP